jgi:hypothetical protein
VEEAWMLINKKSYNRIYLILVTSMISVGTFSYIPSVYAENNQPSSDEEIQLTNSLSKLEIEGAALDQAFSANITAYTATVENEVSSIQILVEAASPNSSITINGQMVTNGKSDSLSLQTGENTILITVNDSSNQSNTYTLTITRKKNGNNSLNNINLSKGMLSPTFDPKITDYRVEVGNEVESITVSPEVAYETETIKVNGTVWEKKGIAIELPVGKSEIPILVTAENGEQKTYLLHVTRAAKQTNSLPGTSTNNRPGTSTSWNGNAKPSTSGYSKSSTSGNLASTVQQLSNTSVQKTSTATLSSLTVSEGTWDSSFSKNEYTYHIALSSNVNTVTISPVANYSSAVISIEGGSTKTISLTESKTVISILVTRGDDRKTYVLVFDKPSVKTQTDSPSVTVSTEGSNSVSTSPADVSTTVSGTAELKVKQNKTTASFWDRIISFFKNIF